MGISVEGMLAAGAAVAGVVIGVPSGIWAAREKLEKAHPSVQSVERDQHYAPHLVGLAQRFRDTGDALGIPTTIPLEVLMRTGCVGDNDYVPLSGNEGVVIGRGKDKPKSTCFDKVAVEMARPLAARLKRFEAVCNESDVTNGLIGGVIGGVFIGGFCAAALIMSGGLPRSYPQAQPN